MQTLDLLSGIGVGLTAQMGSQSLRSREKLGALVKRPGPQQGGRASLFLPSRRYVPRIRFSRAPVSGCARDRGCPLRTRCPARESSTNNPVRRVSGERPTETGLQLGGIGELGYNRGRSPQEPRDQGGRVGERGAAVWPCVAPTQGRWQRCRRGPYFALWRDRVPPQPDRCQPNC